MKNNDEARLLWQPDKSFKDHSNIQAYTNWLREKNYGDFSDYSSLWEWSVANIPIFWETIWKYFDVLHSGQYHQVCSEDKMPHTRWFEGSKLNYAEHIFRNYTNNYPALVYKRENDSAKEISWQILRQQVASLSRYMRSAGVKKGDRIAAYLPNCPQANIAFLATNALGAIWSATSPDFGVRSVIDRFRQINPKVLFFIDGYTYNGKAHSRHEVVRQLRQELPTLEIAIEVPYLNEQDDPLPGALRWDDLTNDESCTLDFERVPFAHPIWVLYSSGTTGLPKPITHSHGGILLEHLKYLTFHNNIKPGDRCFWYTTTGWMMWNYIQASLLCKGIAVLYDGSPAYPDMNVLWKFSEEVRITHFGTSAGYITANMKAETHPGKDYDLSALVSIGSTGSPLPPEGFDWLYKEVKQDLWVASISGGTDVCSAFVGGNPLWPVYSGEIQCRALGCLLEAFNEEGDSIVDQVGEMVITKPMPCMPVYFWNDKNFERYQASYFEDFPGVWRHGDWTRITPRSGIVIYGRSDSTLNRGGVRIGTSEIYSATDALEEIKDSLVVCIEKSNGDFYMPLFVVLNAGVTLNELLSKKINNAIRTTCSPRHVPDDIIAIAEVPYTISGKKVETPVKKILSGQGTDATLNKDALRNPESLNFFMNFANQLKLK
ncbi:MAG: acetoacetate--CoA ligase [Cyclobacteriaceae bacterium]|nr:acetoacetate--CoA ligase [Cyclobacteriaceae bacterium]